MVEMYTLSGGAWFRESFNAIAAFMGTSTWTTIYSIAMVFSVFLTVMDYMRRHDLQVLFHWVIVIVVTNMLVNIKKPVHIIDSSQPTAIYQVDNVPVGLALPAHLFTVMGHALLEGYERVFHLPDSVTYSKGGMLFGANLVVQSTDFISANPEISGLFSDYVHNCVLGDIYLNHKYSLEDLMNSRDPYTLIFEKPSPLRGVFNKNGQFQTCVVASQELTKALGLDTQTGGATWHYYVRSLFGGRPDADILFGELMGNSYQHFYGASQSASEIMKKNVTMNAIRKGISSYASRSGDSAGLLNLSETSALSKLRLSQATSGEITARQLPVMQTVVLGVLIGLFPIIVLLGMLNVVTAQVWKGYLATIIWLQSWPIMYAILNYAMTFNLRQQMNGQPLTLSNISTLQQNFSDIATMSAWISGFIPFLSYALIYGLGKGFSQAGSYMGTATQGASSQSSSQATDGTWAFNNMQTDNVQGFKWDTNSATAHGQMSSITSSGASVTQTAGGNTVYNTSGAMSQLPVHLGFGNRINSQSQQQHRESLTQAQTFQKGYNDGLAFNSMQGVKLAQQMGSSHSAIQGYDASEGSSQVSAFNKMNSAAEQYAKANNIGKTQAWNELMDKGVKESAGSSLQTSWKGGAGVQVAGTGGGFNVESSSKGGNEASSGKTNSTSEKGDQRNDNRYDKNAQIASDFKEGMDVLASTKISQSGNKTDNSSLSKLDDFGASLAKMKNDFSQYSNATTRASEYAEMASMSKDTSAQMDSNYDQQFAEWVTKHSPDNAQEILTNTSSPEIARQREALAQQFVEQELMPRIASDFQENKGGLGEGMASVGPGAGRIGAAEEYANAQKEMDQRAAEKGVPTNVQDRVQAGMDNAQQNIANTQSELSEKQSNVKAENDKLKSEHGSAEQSHNAKYSQEKSAQGEKLDFDKVSSDDPRKSGGSGITLDMNVEKGGD